MISDTTAKDRLFFMKVMLIGPSAAGKTTLIQRLIDKEIKYDKTQTVEYVGNFIDTPGEYMQQRGYWGSLTITSHDADIIGLVQDSTSEDCWFSGGLTSKFESRSSVFSRRLTGRIPIRSRPALIWSWQGAEIFLR